MDYSSFIGKQVLSSSFGVGRVVSIEDIGVEGRLFLVIESEGKSVKNFVAVDDEQSYRLIADKETVEEIFEDFKSDKDFQTFKSKKERIDYFKNQSKIQDIRHIGDLLFHLSTLEDRSSAEQALYSKLKDSLCLEHSIIMAKDVKESMEILETALDS